MNPTSQKEEGMDPVALKDELFELWKCKNVQMLHLSAQMGFSKLSDPLEALLEMLEQCPGKQKGRSHTLGSHIVSEFQIWLKDHPQINLSSLPAQKATALQLRALSLLTESHPTFFDNVINIYQLQSLDAASLRQHISTLQSRNCYKEAVALSIKLKLHSELDIEKMCIPLILLDKLSLAETFVSGHSDLERQLVILMDSWCRPSFRIDAIREQFPQVPSLKHIKSVANAKHLTKHIFRLLDKFKIDQELCPNALYSRRHDTLHFLMYKTFVEKSMTEQNWSDHVQLVVADDRELHIKLVKMLLKYSTLEKASLWSLRYKIPRDRLPHRVWSTQQSLLPDLQQMFLERAPQEDWVPPQAHQQRFYQLQLNKDQVHLVDSLKALQTCRSVLLKEGGIVGVDMEWQPTFGCSSAQQVALIQLAVTDQVFLLDLCAEGFGRHSETVDFIRSLFSDSNILKLGYGLAGGDLKCLRATWHQLLEKPLTLVGVLDLLNIHQMMQRSKSNQSRKGPSEVLVGEDCAEKGLSLLVQQVLGRPLDKAEQMSNWEKRPLRISQIRYAVADAYCLLDVYSVLSSNPAHFGLPADLQKISSSQQVSPEKKKKKEKLAKVENQAAGKKECQGAQRVSATPSDTQKGLLCGEKPSEDGPPLSPQQLRVVCDNMLQGLGRYLRCLGVDVVMLESTDEHREAGKLAQDEGRVILTCGQPFQSLRSQVGEGRCLYVDSSEKARDQAIRVLRHFNILPTPEDIFSRCQACNNDQYVAVPNDDMVRMLKDRGFLKEQEVCAEAPSNQQKEEKPSDTVTAALPRYGLNCRWAPLSDLHPDTLSFPGGAPIQLHTVPPGLLPKIPLFFVCSRCGKVFWEGSHFSRVLSMFHEVLNLTNDNAESTADPICGAAPQN